MDKERIWIRIDNRLVHGQVVENWLPYSNADSLLVVNDALAQDELQQEIMKLAVPNNIQIFFCSLGNVINVVYKSCKSFNCKEMFILFANCADAKRAFETGLDFKMLNVGNIHYAPGKKQVCDHIALSQDDIRCLRYFEQRGIELDFRCIPNKNVQIKSLW